jgi:Eukaryotic phosphomannomutase
MIAAMREEFKHLDLTYSIGGQISFDLFPTVSSYYNYILMIYTSLYAAYY